MKIEGAQVPTLILQVKNPIDFHLTLFNPNEIKKL
jgi:hypothetical protein